MNEPIKLDIPAPPARKSRLPEAPAPAAPPDNLSKPTEDLVDMNFRVPEAFHRQVKITAASWGMSMKDLIKAAYAEWVEKHGSTPKS